MENAHLTIQRMLELSLEQRLISTEKATISKIIHSFGRVMIVAATEGTPLMNLTLEELYQYIFVSRESRIVWYLLPVNSEVITPDYLWTSERICLPRTGKGNIETFQNLLEEVTGSRLQEKEFFRKRLRDVDKKGR